MGTSPRPHHHHRSSFSLTKNKFTLLTISILLPIAFIHFYLFPLPINTINQKYEIKKTPIEGVIIRAIDKNCDYADGRWVQSERGPLYNGTSCGTIKSGQNCMAHGRPDTGYLHWRWQPKSCNLRPFDPIAFLGLIRNKHLAFIGDSLARNQLESLLCLLSTASAPELTYRNGDDDRFRRWIFGSHNATVSVFWSPFLVNGTEKSPETGKIHNELHLDSVDDKWASEFDGMDFVVFAIGHWFLLPAFYYESTGELLGCHHCPGLNDTKEIGFFDVFRKAIRTTLKEVGISFNKHVIVTTFSPAHFEGEWDRAGACDKKEPYKEGEKEMEYMDNEMRKIEVEEVAKVAAEVGGKSGKVRLEVLDVTKLALMRPDGHPGPYMNPNPFADGSKDRVPNDCVHWCMPGPIDMWNEILLEKMMRWEEERR